MSVSPTSVLINEINLHSGIIEREKKSIASTNYWHKIFVRDASKLARNYVMESLMQVVHPFDFIPVSYTREKDNVSFLLKNCGDAINRLCELNLTVPHLVDSNVLPPFKLAMLLKFASASDLKIDVQKNITLVMMNRYNLQSKTLNLDEFHKDLGLEDFIPLCQPKLLYFILHLAKDFSVERLILSNNRIKELKPFEAFSLKDSLKSLDLSKNDIPHINDLIILRQFNALTELNLQDNPLCRDVLVHDYIKQIMKICKGVEKIDGIPILNGFLPMRRNFLCYAPAQQFIDLFLEHFFTIYDSGNRTVLKDLYHPEAMFSMTHIYLLGHLSSSTTDLDVYRSFSRNIKTCFNKGGLFKGKRNITSVLQSLPDTEHDPCTFTVDLMMYTKSMIVFTVTGVFRQPATNLLDAELNFGFSRTFVLTAALNSSDREFNIINEQLHISNATDFQHLNAFKVTLVKRPQYFAIPVATNDAAKTAMVETLSSITDLKHEWARKCLQESDYHLSKAIALFTDLLKNEMIPSQAFSSQLLLRDMNQKNEPPPPNVAVLTKNNEKAAESDDTASKVVNSESQVKPVPTPKPVWTIPKSEKPNLTVIATVEDVDKPKTPPPPLEITIKKGAEQSFQFKDVAKPKTPPPPLKATIKKGAPLVFQFKDPVLRLAFNMKPALNSSIKLKRLEEAGNFILTKYTFALRLYDTLAKEYYRLGFVEQGRAFVEKALEAMPNNIAKDALPVFTAYELEYGNDKQANDLLNMALKINGVRKTVKFIEEVLVPISAKFARGALSGLLNNDLVSSDKEFARAAFKKVCDSIVDVAEEVIEIVDLEEDKTEKTKGSSTSGSELKADDTAQPLIEEKSKPNDKPKETIALECVADDHVDDVINYNDQPKEQSNKKVLETSTSKVLAQACSSVPNKNAPKPKFPNKIVGFVGCRPGQKVASFAKLGAFKKNIFVMAKLVVIGGLPYFAKFFKIKDDETKRQMCLKMIESQGSYSTYKTVLKKLYLSGMIEDVKSILEKCPIQGMRRELLNTIYDVSISQKPYSEIVEPMINNLKRWPANLLVDLFQELEDLQNRNAARQLFQSILTAADMPHQTKVIVASLCQIHVNLFPRDEIVAEELINNFVKIEADNFHPNQVLNEESGKLFDDRFIVYKKPGTIPAIVIENALKDSRNDVYAKVVAVRAFYYHNYRARFVKTAEKIIASETNEANANALRIAIAYYEAGYKESKLFEKLLKTIKGPQNVMCLRLHRHVISKYKRGVRQELQAYLNNVLLVINPYYLTNLREYAHYWMQHYKFNILKCLN